MQNYQFLYKIFLFVFTLCSAFTLSAQSRKQLKKYHVKSVTTVITKTSESSEETYKDSYLKFDDDGNTIEDIQYRKDGTIKSKIISKYNNGNLVEEEEYEGTGKLKSKKTYSYNLEGEKVNESEFDGQHKLIKKSVNLYNNKGLKIEKQVYDGQGKLIMLKKYQYAN